MPEPHPSHDITFERIGKTFGTVTVLQDVSFTIPAGTVHALLGENGAGKSTLMKILSGYHTPTTGEIRLGNQPVHFQSSRDAEHVGIVLIHQEFNLAEDLTVAQNIYLGREPGGRLIDDNSMVRGAQEALNRLGVALDPRTRVRDLTVPQKQLVEIAKALSRNARVLIMDEPTATLTTRETEILFNLIRNLRDEGVTILYISHKLDEVKALADHVTVLRDGRYILSQDASTLTPHEMANLMVGRELEDMFPPKNVHQQAELLSVERLSVPGWIDDLTFTLHAGEVLGFAGLVGAGRTEAFEGLLGLRPHTVGQVRINNRLTRLGSPRRGVKAGLVYLSEDRKGKGVHVDFDLRPNLTLMTLKKYAKPLLDAKSEHAAIQRAAQEYNIRTGRLDVPASALSGGNQQKLALGKILELDPNIVILDEPTRGVDVGAKREIYHLIHRLAEQGKGVIVISSEMQELLGVCHRLIVLHNRTISGELVGDHMTEREVIQYATGLKNQTQRSTAHVYA
ncbi:sugar ABC transporter ATP-binding protein [Deinococcus hopiensis]|uniref:Monosaccharide ABC transporter ATP-binding protein, CUT2 family n=1 Tax=Deinococcus hopiensis KR-140 TaxID=695939 RepID=A0A1W1U9D6_9DEIO|nr:sugar ABC transporter ATP-binding protein [Deinococcus hopiensis]SMB77687.1 monosaccharide ABC transporter ATP-binding protein, CUT2 family [Deinococcus hopiensis KR-140]